MDSLRATGLATPVLAQLQEAWATRYDVYADLLYAHILSLLLPRKDAILSGLLSAATRATSPKDMEVPIWEFTSCFMKRRDEERIFESRIGTTSLPLVPVYTILQTTDLLPRIAATFGAEFYVYSRQKEILSTTDARTQSRRELVLAYYPKGLPPHLLNPVLNAHTRQSTRLPATPRWGESLVYVDPTQTPPSTPQTSPPRLIPRRCYCDHSDQED